MSIPGRSWTRARLLVTIGAAALALVLVALQVLAARHGFEGPLASLARDFVGTPKSMSVPWAGFALALVGLTGRQRLLAVGAAAGLDAVFAAGRLLTGGPAAVGNGPTWVLVGIAVVAAVRWTGSQRADALRGAALGALLILATKFGDVWLEITVLTRPRVLDQYLELADRAFGSPSWVMGRVVEASGDLGYGVLHWVYIELPVAAIVVALYQLRNGWPAHYLVRTFLVIGLIGPLFYLVFPVVGPDFAFGTAGAGAQLGDYWPHTLPTFTDPATFEFDAPAPRNCMPSLHTAWALAIFVHSRGGPRWLRWGGTFWLVCTLAATLGFGYHYAVDLLAGVVLCLTIEAALRDPERGWGRFRVRLVVGGAAVFVALLASYRYLAVPIAQFPELSVPLLLGATGAVVLAFYATFFAASGTALARWGGRVDAARVAGGHESLTPEPDPETVGVRQ
ncbi:PAP2 superfamily protein [Rhodococcus tukisamuensis]|uniref:PAP2 superfamily protein n=1 Tax=Rhodococcus tukisamuensis TaxID=168276 RepID=A0A1G6VSZ9_9NOCA|nr:phosphatase PAP2 family protein [Rhodococcus tukisamuensis]SDD56810.1 PAP2 superfamily protein [Rhodococcus tukisamuensis]